ncbi:uncharacterized protein LOC129599594 [Paramacrobiotus metropolitanus]|uniref:uncharacterized protein LOC129599594 n=1 Tax=Paramacrobiotus metropolitanus TaxID=2943436 RepID=UPI0024464354|nr:uncharacterized protein LOC129599594 [Paramacrobiotus metropolitanus]
MLTLLMDAGEKERAAVPVAGDNEAMTQSHLTEHCSVSVSDLQLCLGLQGHEAPLQRMPHQRHQDSGTNTSFSMSAGSQPPSAWSSRTPGEAMASTSLLSSAAPCFCSGCSGDSRWQYSDDDYTSPSAALGLHYHHPGLADSLHPAAPDRPPRQMSASMPPPQFAAQVTDSGDSKRLLYQSAFVGHSLPVDRSAPSQSESLELDLSGSLRFSPLTSASNLFQTSSTSPLESGESGRPSMSSKFNYFLAFNDLQHSGAVSHIQPDASLLDSGTVCPEEAPDPGGKLRCWTDVAESYMETPVSASVIGRTAESVIAPLNEVRKRATTAKMAHSGSPECQETSASDVSATSGYSSSRSLQNANTPGRQAFSQQSGFPSPAQGIRQSPSLPLNVGTGCSTAETLQRNYEFSQKYRHTASANALHPDASPTPTPTDNRSKHSAPNLPFLSAAPASTRSATQPPTPPTKMPRPFSCPERFLPGGGDAGAPLRVNTVDDWESLRVLLPTPFQRFFRAPEAAVQRLPSVPWGVHSDEERLRRRDSEEVCPTCFKMVETGGMTQSVCDCSPVFPASPTSSSSSKSAEMVGPGQSARMSLFDDLMEFSQKDTRNTAPTQIVVNLKHKQELVTAVKAAAVGLIGLAGFRGMQKDKTPEAGKHQQAENLSRMILHQFIMALQRLLEDGIHRGYSVWSVLVTGSSSTGKKRRNSHKTGASMAVRVKELVKAIEGSPLFQNDQQCFALFVTELLRLGELKDWLRWRIEQTDICAQLRAYYAMDGFVFLASSITKDLWEDLLDTLNCLKFPPASATRKPSEPASLSLSSSVIQPTIGSPRQPVQSSPRDMTTSSSVKRLAEKLGLVHRKEDERRFSLLPSYPTQMYVPSRRKKTTPVEAPPPVDYAAQPHLSMHMKSRWSEWHLSRLAESTDDVPGEPPERRGLGAGVGVAGGIGRTKSPSLFDIRTFVQ